MIQVDSSQVNFDNCSITQQRLLNCMNELHQNNSNLAHILLKRVKDNTELAVTDHNFIMDALPPEMITNLHETAKLMVDAGLEKEFSEAYCSWWREFLEECLINKVLGLRKIGFQDYMIGRWIKVSKVALRILFPGGRRLCERVFSGFSSSAAASDLCILEVCGGAMIQLLNFADAFINRSPSAWRLFKILDMFQTLQGLIPEIQSMFPDSLVNETMRIQKRLGEASRDIFMEFGNLIFDIPDAGLDALADGGVHRMTTGVMGYIIPAFWSRQILEKILGEFPKFAADGEETSSFSTQMERIMEQLERKLEEKSRIYTDPALPYFFMMNNLRCIDGLLGTFGDDRFQKKTQHNFELYYRSSWSKVLEFLKPDNSESPEPNVAAESLKEKLNLFYLHFRETCGVQSTWCVCDKQLLKQIIESVENMVLPAYENFIQRFKDVLGEHSDEYVEYGISDVQGMLNSTIRFSESC
ncbi:exocyst complex component EXO70B1-like [Lotus japonicus]|uniref:exocyst complex component EXO70B1-like n=1 Tax=Lotus japonicus TaxID=34305 RepID=UPI002590936B|nr:exocyst complex component EXO70B1-like [Lotus japonicus]